MGPTKDLESQASPLSMSRRDFLRLAGAAVGVIASACAPNPTPESGKALATVIDLVTATSLPVEPTKEPTPKPTQEVKPTYTPLPPTPEKVATPTAEAYDVMAKIEEAAPVVIGGEMFGVWPEAMEKEVAPDFSHFEVDPAVSPLQFKGETKILVSPETKKAGSVLIPWQPDQENWQEGKPSEPLAFFGSLLPKTLTDGGNLRGIEYLPYQEVGQIPEKLHLAVYKNSRGEIEALVVPFVTEETVGKDGWTKILALKTAGTLGNVITGIETVEVNGKTQEKPVMIFLDKNGNELLRTNLGMAVLEKPVKEADLGKSVRLGVDKGQYTFYGEDGKEIPEKAIKLWEVPVLPEPVEPELKAPEIEGLKIVEKDGRQVYVAEAGNPYGLKEGDEAGYFYPEVFRLGKEDYYKSETQTGAVCLGPGIVKTLLLKSGYPEKVVFDLPFDLNTAEQERTIYWFVKANSGKEYLCMHVPSGSRLVAGFPRDKDVNRVRIAPQSWENVAITYEPGGVFNGYVLTMVLPDNKSKGGDFSYPYGSILPDYSIRAKFSDGYIGYLEQRFFIPVQLRRSKEGWNTIIYLNTLVDPIKHLNINEDNILKINGVPVFMAGL